MNHLLDTVILYVSLFASFLFLLEFATHESLDRLQRIIVRVWVFWVFVVFVRGLRVRPVSVRARR